jgi:hypothetical protein
MLLQSKRRYNHPKFVNHHDECNPNNLNPIDVDDIIKMASLAEPNVIILFKSLLKEL